MAWTEYWLPLLVNDLYLGGRQCASPVATASVTGSTVSSKQPYPQPHPGMQKDAPLEVGDLSGLSDKPPAKGPTLNGSCKKWDIQSFHDVYLTDNYHLEKKKGHNLGYILNK